MRESATCVVDPCLLLYKTANQASARCSKTVGHYIHKILTSKQDSIVLENWNSITFYYIGWLTSWKTELRVPNKALEHDYGYRTVKSRIYVERSKGLRLANHQFIPFLLKSHKDRYKPWMTQYLTPFFSEKSNSTKGGKVCNEMFEMLLDQIAHGCLGEH